MMIYTTEGAASAARSASELAIPDPEDAIQIIVSALMDNKNESSSD